MYVESKSTLEAFFVILVKRPVSVLRVHNDPLGLIYITTTIFRYIVE